MRLVADANSVAWGFWEHWADGRWHDSLHQIIDAHCYGGTFVDIGAWIGPTAIWAAEAGYSRIVAVEPDPLAYEMLRINTEQIPDVERYDVAVTDRDGVAFIERRGDSMARTDVPDADHPVVATRCMTMATLFERFNVDDVDLIKMDVEGAEALIVPEAAEFLRTVGAPIHLSLHPWAPLDLACLDGWTIEQIDEHELMVTP